MAPVGGSGSGSRIRQACRFGAIPTLSPDRHIRSEYGAPILEIKGPCTGRRAEICNREIVRPVDKIARNKTRKTQPQSGAGFKSILLRSVLLRSGQTPHSEAARAGASGAASSEGWASSAAPSCALRRGRRGRGALRRREAARPAAGASSSMTTSAGVPSITG